MEIKGEFVVAAAIVMGAAISGEINYLEQSTKISAVDANSAVQQVEYSPIAKAAYNGAMETGFWSILALATIRKKKQQVPTV